MIAQKIKKSDALLVLLCSSADELNTTRIARELKMYSGNASKLITKLEKKGLIKKHKEIGDKSVTISLTRKGKSLTKGLHKVMDSL